MSEEKNKPVLDERTFDKLLEAAYVIQQHHRKLRDAEERMESHTELLRQQEHESARQAPLPASRPAPEESPRSDGDYTLTLAEIVEAQRQIQARHLELDKALAVVAEKVSRITSATGAGIGILEEKTVRYRAGAGASALPPGSEVPLASAVCAANIRTGQVVRSEDVNTEVLFDPEPCRQRGILSLVAVPIYHDGDIVGGLEIYFDKIHGYAEQDIHTCQLMAGLVTEAIGRDTESKLKKSMAAERSTMLAAIERLQPNLVALAQDQSAATAKPEATATAATAAKSSCWKCGDTLIADEQFCGKCGAPRVTDGDHSSMQSKLASAWHMQQTSHETPAASGARETPHPVDPDNVKQSQVDLEKDTIGANPPLGSSDPLFAESFTGSAEESLLEEPSLSSAQVEVEEEADNVEAPSTALVRPKQEGEDVVWSSAAKARDFWESLAATRSPGALVRFWRSRRGDFYLAIAVILMVVVIRWGIWSNHSVGATGGTLVSGSAVRHKRPAPDADLSLFDKLLISLGLAEAPDEAPEYKGNPDIQVWVDLHTALYYCPGSDLYGKTPKGKLASQREAQLDQFEPANRKACD